MLKKEEEVSTQQTNSYYKLTKVTTETNDIVKTVYTVTINLLK